MPTKLAESEMRQHLTQLEQLLFTHRGSLRDGYFALLRRLYPRFSDTLDIIERVANDARLTAGAYLRNEPAGMTVPDFRRDMMDLLDKAMTAKVDEQQDAWALQLMAGYLHSAEYELLDLQVANRITGNGAIGFLPNIEFDAGIYIHPEDHSYLVLFANGLFALLYEAVIAYILAADDRLGRPDFRAYVECACRENLQGRPHPPLHAATQTDFLRTTPLNKFAVRFVLSHELAHLQVEQSGEPMGGAEEEFFADSRGWDMCFAPGTAGMRMAQDFTRQLGGLRPTYIPEEVVLAPFVVLFVLELRARLRAQLGLRTADSHPPAAERARRLMLKEQAGVPAASAGIARLASFFGEP
jgi:hypothetical protein